MELTEIEKALMEKLSPILEKFVAGETPEQKAAKEVAEKKAKEEADKKAKEEAEKNKKDDESDISKKLDALLDAIKSLKPAEKEEAKPDLQQMVKDAVAEVAKNLQKELTVKTAKSRGQLLDSELSSENVAELVKSIADSESATDSEDDVKPSGQFGRDGRELTKGQVRKRNELSKAIGLALSGSRLNTVKKEEDDED